jgi:NTE family protein
VEPLLETLESSFDLFGPGNRRTDRITNATTGVSTALGRRLGNIGVVRLALGYERYRSSPLISSLPLSPANDSGKYARLGTTFDTLDDADFPRSGYLVNAVASKIDYSSDPGNPVQTYILQALLPVTYGRFTLLGLAAGGRSRDDRGGFDLGGFLNMSGTPVGAIAGSQAAIVAAVAYYRMGELPRGIGRNWYAGLSLEAGNAWARRSDIDFGNVRRATAVFIGLDTLIGPLYLGYGHTFSGDSALYLYLGRPTERGRGIRG